MMYIPNNELVSSGTRVRYIRSLDNADLAHMLAEELRREGCMVRNKSTKTMKFALALAVERLANRSVREHDLHLYLGQYFQLSREQFSAIIGMLYGIYLEHDPLTRETHGLQG